MSNPHKLALLNHLHAIASSFPEGDIQRLIGLAEAIEKQRQGKRLQRSARHQKHNTLRKVSEE
jgi:hypothetical protein